MEFASFGGNLSEAVGESVEETTSHAGGKVAAVHFEHVLSDVERTEQTGQVGRGGTDRGG